MRESQIGVLSKDAVAARQIWQITRFIKQQEGVSHEEFLRQYAESIRQAFPGNLESGAVPVLICARNEIDNIGRTLYGLAQSDKSVQPVVVDNGSDDGTGDFARSLGAIVIPEKQAGLLNAIRTGYTYLRDMGYKDPILFTDADTVPLPRWSSTMLQHARSSISDGGVSYGPIFYYDREDQKSHLLKNSVLSLGANVLDRRAVKNEAPRARGPNGILIPDANGQILENLSQLTNTDNSKYGMDIKVLNSVIDAGGDVSYCGSLDALIVTSGRRYPKMQNVAGRIFRKEKEKETAYRNWGR